MKITSVKMALAAFIISTPALSADLIYASFYPPGHILHEYGIEPMIKELEGVVDVQFLPGGQLFNASAALESLSTRVADVGPGVSTYWPTDLKHVNVVSELMMLGEHPMIMNAAMLDTVINDCENCRKDYEDANLLHLGSIAAGGYGLICNSVVSGLQDLQGKKIRTTGGPLARLAESWGAQTVNLTVSDMVEGLQRGVVDCILGPVAWIKAYPMIDAVESIYDYNKGMFVGIGAFIINRDAWSGLEPEQREKIISVLPGAIAGATVRGYLTDELAARKMADEAGIQMVKAGDDFEAAFEEFKQAEIAATVAAATELGVENPQQIADMFVANIEKWTKIIEEADIDLAAIDEATESYEQLLWEHIYSKLDPEAL